MSCETSLYIETVETLLEACRQRGVLLRTAESCTAGAIAAAIASVPGASIVLDRGWITYSNQAKMDELAVPEAALKQYGAVSQVVVKAMAEGGSDAGVLCVAVSGIAGPGGGSAEKPVGTVWIATSLNGQPAQAQMYRFSGDRQAIQQQTVLQALRHMLQCVQYEVNNA